MTRFLFLLPLPLLALMSLVACTAMQYDLPSVASDSDGLRRPGKFLWHDLISDTPEASRDFYSALFGWEFRKLPLSGANYWTISLGGRPVGGMVDQSSLAAQRDVSQWISVLSVEDAETTLERVESAGGTVYRRPVSVGSRGTIAVYADPSGAVFAALQTRAGDPRDSDELPPQGMFLWHELWTPDAAGAARFYATLADLEVNTRDSANASGEPVEYRILSDRSRLRAGVRSLPDPAMPSVWMPYLRIENRAGLDDILQRVVGLGGEVLVPAVPRPAGGHLAVIADPSGAPLALQTWSAAQPMLGRL